MKYVPNLIPERSRVLQDYFRSGKHTHKPSGGLLWRVLGWIGGVFFLLSALAFIPHPALAILFGLLGLILLPPGHRWLEKKLQFNLTRKVKLISGIGLFAASMPLVSYYQDVDQQQAEALKLKEEKAKQASALAAKKEQDRKDSLTFYLKKSATAGGERKMQDAYGFIDRASVFTVTEEDVTSLKKARVGIASLQAVDLVKATKYNAALPILDSLLLEDYGNSELLYNRAVCYSKTGNIEDAVMDCKMAIDKGHSQAEKLYNALNPELKRVVGYVTRCCDGSTSHAKGRGACSHHGGVCNWNEPIYETYRKYQ